MATINISFELTDEQLILLRDREEINNALKEMWKLAGAYHGWSDMRIESAYDDLQEALGERLRLTEEELYGSFDRAIRAWDTDFEVIS